MVHITSRLSRLLQHFVQPIGHATSNQGEACRDILFHGGQAGATAVMLGSVLVYLKPWNSSSIFSFSSGIPMRRLAVIPGDPIFKYYQKGEIKARYWNPCEIFDEVHILSLNKKDIKPEKVQSLVGRAKLHIHALGRPNVLTLIRYYPKVARFLQELNPDIVRSHGPWHSGSIAFTLQKNRRSVYQLHPQ